MIYYVFQFYVRIKIIFVYNPQFHEQGNIVYLTISNQSAIIHCKWYEGYVTLIFHSL